MRSAIVRVERKPAWADIFRSYKIFLDRQMVGHIKEGMDCLFEVQPGYHEIYLTIDWCSSRHIFFVIAPSEEIKFICVSDNAFAQIVNMIFAPQDYIKLYRE